MENFVCIKNNTFVAFASKYDIDSYNMTIKMAVWKTLAVSLQYVLI